MNALLVKCAALSTEIFRRTTKIHSILKTNIDEA